MPPPELPLVTVVAFLELLEQEASPAFFDELAARLSETGHEVAAVRTRALRVRSLLERRRRRDDELSALYDTTNDLASLQDLEAVLESIAQRARRLLRSDVAYLSLMERESASTSIQVADGSISSALRALRLDLDVGIGGVVARRASAFQTADYLQDPDLAHDRAVDAAVDAEGLVAILGVPLLVAGQVIGVLFAAERRARTFTTDEVALLSSLATHAALAIEKTRLLQDARASVQQLEAAQRTIEKHISSVERAASAHERLTEIVLRGGGLPELAQAVVDVLGGTVVVVDAQGHPLAGVGPCAAQAEGLTEHALRLGSTTPSSAAGAWWLAPVTAEEHRLGTLLLLPDAPLADADRRILERAALVTALLLVWRQSLAEAELQGRGDLLHDILTGAGRATQVERCRSLGLDPHTELLLLVLRGAPERQLLTAAARQTPLRGGLLGAHDGAVVAVLPRGTSRRAAEEASALARAVRAAAGTGVTTGVAVSPTGVDGLQQAYQEAERCVAALLALGREGDVADTAGLGFVGVLLSEQGRPQRFVKATLGPVLEHDTRRATELLRTLETWFAQDRMLGRTAAALHVHPNTVAQRLDRVTQLLGEQWRSPARALEVQLALQLRRLMRPSHGA